MAERAARYQRARKDDWRLPELADEFIARHGNRVLHGPFGGMGYWRGGDSPVAKLLGAYELEIRAWISEALQTPPPVFVDLGAADGFYAVGVAVASPETNVIAFELSSTARSELRHVARLNGVNLTISRRATARALRSLPLKDGLVLCDIEGAEADVLVGGPHLAATTLIVELHEAARPGATDLLRERFESTHIMETMSAQPRDPAAFPELEGLSNPVAALDEHRAGKIVWARFLPRSGLT